MTHPNGPSRTAARCRRSSVPLHQNIGSARGLFSDRLCRYAILGPDIGCMIGPAFHATSIGTCACLKSGAQRGFAPAIACAAGEVARGDRSASDGCWAPKAGYHRLAQCPVWRCVEVDHGVAQEWTAPGSTGAHEHRLAGKLAFRSDRFESRGHCRWSGQDAASMQSRPAISRLAGRGALSDRSMRSTATLEFVGASVTPAPSSVFAAIQSRRNVTRPSSASTS